MLCTETEYTAAFSGITITFQCFEIIFLRGYCIFLWEFEGTQNLTLCTHKHTHTHTTPVQEPLWCTSMVKCAYDVHWLSLGQPIRQTAPLYNSKVLSIMQTGKCKWSLKCRRSLVVIHKTHQQLITAWTNVLVLHRLAVCLGKPFILAHLWETTGERSNCSPWNSNKSNDGDWTCWIIACNASFLKQ